MHTQKDCENWQKEIQLSLDKKALAKRKKNPRLWKRFIDIKDAKVFVEHCRCRNQVRRLTRKAVEL